MQFYKYLNGAICINMLQYRSQASSGMVPGRLFRGMVPLERFTFEKGETRGGGTAPPGPK